MQCLTDLGANTYAVASPQPTELSGCTYLIAQPSELPSGFMNMTTEEGLTVGGLLATVLLVGFTFRAMAHALNFNEKGDKDD